MTRVNSRESGVGSREVLGYGSFSRPPTYDSICETRITKNPYEDLP
jgi:hypothetical protein